MIRLYLQSRTCGTCSHQESRELSAHEAAFIERHEWGEPCPKCGNSLFCSGGFSDTPPIDAGIMELWSKNERLSFSEIDEDMLLGCEEILDLLIQYVQRNDILESKRGVLISALCLLVYDNTDQGYERDIPANDFLANQVIEFLSNNHRLFENLHDDYGHHYIKVHVYPLIGLPEPTAT